jgi:hypothetical protein
MTFMDSQEVILCKKASLRRSPRPHSATQYNESIYGFSMKLSHKVQINTNKFVKSHKFIC